MHLDELKPGLAAFVHDTFGSAARLDAVRESDGHAGLTFLFDVVEGSAARHAYVIKLPPKGVRRRGNTDVLRQAPLLRALLAAGLPVPEVPFAHDDNPWFEVPFIVMQRLPGRTFFVWQPDPQLDLTPAPCQRRWEESARWLARLHAFDWRSHLPTWEEVTPIEDEVTRWQRIYGQAPEPDWIAAADKTAQTLLETLPPDPPCGLIHGDYQPGNCLYRDDTLCGIIDWELSGIGGCLLDVGWLSMIADSVNWTPGWQPLHPVAPARLQAVYEEAGGRCGEYVAWYQALAGYRLASISCLNVKLHRKGQRHDPIWEHNARSVMPMFSRAQQLLATLC